MAHQEPTTSTVASAEAPSAPVSTESRPWAQDLSSGLVVFLVALPLCLGIALASGAPLISGVISGVIGGIVVGLASGSQLSVSGPAAGLVVIVVDAVAKMGGFPQFTAAVVVAGIIQIIFGYLKAGALGEFFPNSVIRGTLAGIGAVIVLKQIPHALGHKQQFEAEIGFAQIGTPGENTFSEILISFSDFSLLAILISVVSLVLLIVWELPAIRKSSFGKVIPGPLVVVVFGTVVNEIARVIAPSLALLDSNQHLVSLPTPATMGELVSTISFPDFGAMFTTQCLITAFTLAAVASLESLAAIEATDRLDPKHRITPTNRELKAQGLGNIVAGLVGGLPVTSVVVRSSANIYAGAQTKFSTVAHGVMLLLAVTLIPALLNRIPIAALATVLIFIGFKLCHPKLFVASYRQGWSQFSPFLVTFLALVFTDLLIGIMFGMLVGLFFVIRTTRHDAITLVQDGTLYLMRFNKDLSFLHKAELKERLLRIPDGAEVIFDGVKAGFIDHDIWEVLNDFRQSARFRNIGIEWKHLDPWWDRRTA